VRIAIRPSPGVPGEGDTARAVVTPTVSTLRVEMAVSGQRLLAACGQIPMAAHTNAQPMPRPLPRHARNSPQPWATMGT
jgi:hypothetical protein